MRLFRALTAALIMSFLAVAQLHAKDDPVQWTLHPVSGFGELKAGTPIWLELTADVQPGWHLYSPTTPAGGPIVTKVQLVRNAVVSEAKVFRPQPVRKADPNFGIETETYSDKAVFYIEAEAKAEANGPVALQATAYYQACNDVKCLRAVRKTVSASVVLGASFREAKFSVPNNYVVVAAPAFAAPVADGPASYPTS